MKSTADPNTSLTLLAALHSEDQAAWNRFFALYRPAVDCWCARRLPPTDADEAASAVWCRLVQSIPSFIYHPQKGRFRDWLCRLVHNEVINYFRQKQAREGRIQPVDASLLDFLPRAATHELADELDGFLTEDLRLADEIVSKVRERFLNQNWEFYCQVALHGRPASVVARESGYKLHRVTQAVQRIRNALRTEAIRVCPDRVHPSPE